MSRWNLEPRLENLYVEDLEQLRALANPIHRKIFDFLEENQAGTEAEIAAGIKMKIDNLENYLYGLAQIGLLEKRELSMGEVVYLPQAKNFTVSHKAFAKQEEADSIREILVDRIADLAKDMANLGEGYMHRGRISFSRFNFSDEDIEWARAKISELVKGLNERSKKSAVEEGVNEFRLALLFYPPK